jgi:dolichyl-diphosphooligosaccharide--protein glycosyltransferase
VVSGESRSYEYARTQYPELLRANTEQLWYERLRDRVGFVVYGGIVGPPGSISERLAAYGSRTRNASGLAHFRAVYISPNEQYRVFTLVPGATITGTATPNAELTALTTVEISNQRIQYNRRVQTGPDGRYNLTVPYPGTYQIGNQTVTVASDAVHNGTQVVVRQNAGTGG